MAQGFASDIPPAVNGTAKKYIRGMMKGKNRWNKLYGNRSKEVMHKTANKMAMGEMSKMPRTYNDLFGEANKSGDNSLRCLLYTSPSPRDLSTSRMPSSA